MLEIVFWAFAYNIIAIPFAIIGVLHPVIAETSRTFSSWGVQESKILDIAMALSSITVVTNANLLRRRKI